MNSLPFIDRIFCLSGISLLNCRRCYYTSSERVHNLRIKTVNANTTTYLSNGPLTLLIEIVDRVSMVHMRESLRSGVKQEEEDASRTGCRERTKDRLTLR